MAETTSQQVNQAARSRAVPASLMMRLLATGYDLVILFGLLFVAFAITTQISTLPANHWANQLLVSAIAFAYFAGFWTKGGATTGMRPWKLHVAMQANGDYPSFAISTIRFLALAITWIAFGVTFFQLMTYLATGVIDKLTFTVASLIPVISMLCFLLTPSRQPLHDLLAGTNVYKIKS